MGGSKLFEGESRAPEFTITSIVFCFVAFIFIILRFVTRAFIVCKIGADDWVILLAWICSLGVTITIILQVQHGHGRHVWTVSPHDLTAIVKILYFLIIFYQVAVVLVKVSILLQYRRWFKSNTLRKFNYIMAAVTFAFGVGCVSACVFTCHPIVSFWDTTIPGQCIDKNAFYLAAAITNGVTDFFIFLLPLPTLRKLKLPRRQKIALLIVFAIGFFVCVMTIARTIALYDYTKSVDFTWDNGPVSNWSSIEVNVGIMCASIPGLKPFAIRFFPALVNPRYASRSPPVPQDEYIERSTTGAPSKADATLNDKIDTDVVSSKTDAVNPRIRVFSIFDAPLEDPSEGTSRNQSLRRISDRV